MAGRNDAAIAAALEAMAQALEHQPNVGENSASRNLATFQRENPPVFKGTHDFDGALTWLKEIERIFRVIDCTLDQKVWEFLRKYFREDVRGKKEIEFLELRQGNKSVVEYAAKFGELAKFYQHYDGPDGEFSKCIKFKNGLRPEIKKAISYQKIRVFADLVDSCWIYKEDNNVDYRVISEKRGKSQQGRGKPYDAPFGKGKQKAYEGKKTSRGDAPAGNVCFKCGKVGHKSTVCTVGTKRCFRCGKIGHEVPKCKHKDMVCFNCGEEGHIGSKFQKPKKEQASGKVFVLSGTQTTRKANVVVDALSRKTLHMSAMMVKELELIEQFRDMSLKLYVIMDHSLMKVNRLSKEYKNGLIQFLDFAEKYLPKGVF
ncbi:uncharacterized protein LOC131649085 [Vicia villosa]|uniref:uncharacterized protein LOC131649085 n=1 Tax=Vicia villosa TaxID=3911 RepID=UPI00273AB034|nr:uncharacterized protein LOC131649085 [Vicia villosa]